jgi:putative transposase
MERGFMYLTAVIDWHSRYVLSWKLSNTMTVEFCKECLQEAIDNYGSPKIFNSDQGSQFTSEKFTNIWQENKLEHVQISMDGRGRATDNAFIERVWRSVKQEKIYTGKFENGTQLWMALVEYFNFYNHDRPHQSLHYKSPVEIYQPSVMNILTDINKEKVAKRNFTTSTSNE